MLIPVDDQPKTIEEDYQYIDNMNTDYEKWLKRDLEGATAEAHHSIGQWIRNNFGLWEKHSNLKDWFIENYMLDHPDDISSLILIYFHKKKNGVDTDLTKYVNKYHKYWEKHIPNYKLKLRKHKLKRLCSKLVIK